MLSIRGESLGWRRAGVEGGRVGAARPAVRSGEEVGVGTGENSELLRISGMSSQALVIFLVL